MRTRCWHHIWRGNVFSRKPLFSERGVANTQLNSTIYASKGGPNWVNSVNFGWKKWRGWCGKPFGIISEHNFFFEKNALFWPPYTCRPSHRPFLCGQFWVGNWAVSRASRHLRGSDCFQKHFLHQDLFEKIQLTPCENSMLTSHLTWKWIFEKIAVFWAWYGQNTAKVHHICLKMGSKLDEIGRF